MAKTKVDFKWDTNGQLVIIDGDIATVSGDDYLKQKLRIKFSAQKREYQYDNSDGFDWFNIVFNANMPIDVSKVQLEAVRVATSIEEIASIMDFSFTVPDEFEADNYTKKRNAIMRFTAIKKDGGELPFVSEGGL